MSERLDQIKKRFSNGKDYGDFEKEDTDWLIEHAEKIENYWFDKHLSPLGQKWFNKISNTIENWVRDEKEKDSQ